MDSDYLFFGMMGGISFGFHSPIPFHGKHSVHCLQPLLKDGHMTQAWPVRGFPGIFVRAIRKDGFQSPTLGSQAVVSFIT